MLVSARQLTREAFHPFGHVIEPRRTSQRFDRSNPYAPGVNHEYVPLVLLNGEPVLRIMHQRLRGLEFNKLACHKRVSQCLGAIGGKDWYLAVAEPDKAVTLQSVTAFHIPGDRIVKLHV
jgi:ureidoglycolate hydrolase